MRACQHFPWLDALHEPCGALHYRPGVVRTTFELPALFVAKALWSRCLGCWRKRATWLMFHGIFWLTRTRLHRTRKVVVELGISHT